MNNLFTFENQRHPFLMSEIPFQSNVSLREELRVFKQLEQMSERVGGMADVMGAMVTDAEQDWGRAYMQASTSEEFDRLNEELNQLIETRVSAEGEFVDVETLKSKYAEYLDVERPMTDDEARLIYEKNREEAVRASILARGDSGVVGAIAKFGVGLLDAATDPGELAVAFLSAGVAPAVMGLRAATRAGRVGLGAFEGLVGSAAAEGVIYAATRNQQIDYSMNELLLNTTLGMFLGGGVGALTRGIEADMGKVALNQVLNDKPVDLSPFMRDLRSTTAYGRVAGVEFQPSNLQNLWDDFRGTPRANVDIAAVPTRSPVTTMVLGPDNTQMRYSTVQKADTAAAKVGGSVFRAADGSFAVRQPVGGDFVLSRDGTPLTFPTQRAADKFIGATRDGQLPDGAVSVPIFRQGARTAFGVAGNMSDKTLRDIKTGNAHLNIPRGQDATAVETANPVPPEVGINPAVSAAAKTVALRGDAAYERMAKEYASRPSKPSSSSILDVSHGEGADAKIAAEELEGFREMAGADAKMEAAVDAAIKGRIDGVIAAAKCMVKVSV